MARWSNGDDTGKGEGRGREWGRRSNVGEEMMWSYDLTGNAKGRDDKMDD